MDDMDEKISNLLERILSRFSAEMVSKTNHEMVARSAVISLKEILSIDAVAFFLLEQGKIYSTIGGKKRVEQVEMTRSALNRLSLDAIDSRKLQYRFGAEKKDSYFKLGGSAVSVPIILSEEVVGVLIAESSKDNFFSKDGLIAIKVAAHITGLTIEKTRFLAKERKRSNERAGLQSTMTEVIRELDLPTLLQSIVAQAASLLDVTGGELGIYEEENQELTIVVSNQLSQNHVGEIQRLGEG